MQVVQKVQAVIITGIMAIAAGCTATRTYTAKLFPVRLATSPDSLTTKAPRFLDMEMDPKNSSNWVSSDAIMGRDTVNKTAALDKLAVVYPAAPVRSDSSRSPASVKTEPAPNEPVVRTARPGEVRSKRVRDE